ncbi:MAG: glycosyltransferase [Candidatus Delongbacteria bacterium]|nr:glycosyltransferase [Candidatus Delongbacteria bacterium]
MESIDIIIPFVNQLPLTLRLLKQIKKNTEHLDVRIILINDGSDEAFPDEFNHMMELFQVKLITNRINRGFIYSVNRGLQFSQADYKVILNNDVFLTSRWLELMIDVMKNHENLGILGPLSNVPFFDYPGYVNLGEKINRGNLNTFNKMISGIHPSRAFQKCDFIFGFCMMVKKRVTDKIGGFDTRFGYGFFEDIDFCWRAQESGFETGICKNVYITHINGVSFHSEKRISQCIKNLVLLKEKWNHHPLIQQGIFDELNYQQLNIPDLQLTNSRYFFFDSKQKKNPRRFLLINPPVRDTREYWHYMSTSVGRNIPSGLLRIAHYLLDQGNYVNFYDFMPYFKGFTVKLGQKKLENLKKNLYHYGLPYGGFRQFLADLKSRGDIPDEVMITATFTYHVYNVKKLVRLIKRIFPSTRISIGGPAANLIPDELSIPECDNVHVGEYEDAHCYYPLMQLMDFLPDRAILRFIKGCPNHCSYCAVPKVENRLVRYSFEKIINEFLYYYQLGIKEFMVWDSNLMLSKDNLVRFLQFLVQQNYPVSIDGSYGFQIDKLNDEFFQHFVKINQLEGFFIPLESAVYRIYYDRFHKPAKMNKIYEQVTILRKHQLRYLFYVIIGLPEQTVEEILDSVIFAHKQGGTAILMIFTPIPQTEEYINYRKFFRSQDYEELNGNFFPIINSALSPGVMQEIFDLFWDTSLVNHNGWKLKCNTNDQIIDIDSSDNWLMKIYRNRFYPARIIPKLDRFCFGEVLKEHVIRYRLAKSILKKKVIDLGSGAGYGLYILRDSIVSGLGLEKEMEAVYYARDNYQIPTLTFEQADFYEYSYPCQYDGIIAFEVIEHLDDQDRFIQLIKRILKPDGTAIISTPRRKDSGFDNPHHVKELFLKEFIGLLDGKFNYVLYGQTGCTVDLVENEKNAEYDYFIAVCRHNND